MEKSKTTALQIISVTVILCLAIVSITGPATGLAEGSAVYHDSYNGAANPPTDSLAPDGPYDMFLPSVYRWDTPPMVTLTSASTTSTNGSEQVLFKPGDAVRYNASGRNDNPFNVTITLRWEQENPCGITVVFNQTLDIPPGDWTHTTTGVIPDCPGIFTSTVRVSNAVETASLAMLDVVNPPSIVQINNQQGFDRCHLPSVPQMQTWWNSSPYWVFNIYLGGSMFYCDDEIPDVFWVHQVAGQGWKFILTWVGPQAPCSVFREKMSTSTSTARQQGRTEASAAAAAASQMGFLGDRVIYYDLEAYGSSASTECRAAVTSFIRGWTERLHELGYLAGGYGSPLTSHIADWASNSPPPDFIWIAHWLSPAQYRPDATVSSSYLSDSLWNNHQRIRQYAGGHNETWGSVTLDLDSNVLDGAITTIPLAPASASSSLLEGDSAPAQVQQVASLPPIRDMHLLTQELGWALQGERLLLTQDNGANWEDITPPDTQAAPILAVQMLDRQRGWVVTQGDAPDRLLVQRTADGGASWVAASLQLPPAALSGVPVAAGFLDFMDEKNGWLALRLQSGSSFSLGRLFATQDGGATWEERTLPIGDAVHFSNARQGWVAGGPGGDQLFRTLDGGYTWKSEDASSQELRPQLPAFGDLPVLKSVSAGATQWIIVQDGSCSGDKAAQGNAALQCYQKSGLYSSTDGGADWSEITPVLK